MHSTSLHIKTSAISGSIYIPYYRGRCVLACIHLGMTPSSHIRGIYRSGNIFQFMRKKRDPRQGVKRTRVMAPAMLIFASLRICGATTRVAFFIASDHFFFMLREN